MTRIHATSLALLMSVPVLAPGCKKQDTDSPDVASAHRNNKYKSDIVTGTYSDDHQDQGKGIQPNTLRSIEDTINNSYEKDFSRCLEDEMAVDEAEAFLADPEECRRFVELTGVDTLAPAVGNALPWSST